MLTRQEDDTQPDARFRAAELFERHGPAVYRRCRRLLGDADAARDATQEVFVQLLRNMRRLEGRETVLPWVYRVATNHCLNLRRTRQRQGLSEGVDLEVLPSPASPAYPERQLAAAVLARFDAGTQAIAIGILVDGMEQQELASALGVSTRTVSRKLERFLVNARKYLARSAA